MIAFKVKDRSEIPKLLRKARRANIQSMHHAAGYLRKVAKNSIKNKPGPSEAPAPPHTHTKRLKHAILYAVEPGRQSAVIGTDVRKFGKAGKPHEHGGRYMGQTFKRRPFMRPALLATIPKLPRHWAGSIR